MSRIGKAPINIPNGVNVSLEDNLVKVKGPKGELFQKIESDGITVEINDNVIQVNSCLLYTSPSPRDS